MGKIQWANQPSTDGCFSMTHLCMNMSLGLINVTIKGRPGQATLVIVNFRSMQWALPLTGSVP